MTNYTQWKSLVDLHEYSAIPDAQHEYRLAEGNGTTSEDEVEDNDLTLEGGVDWVEDGDSEGGFHLDFRNTRDVARSDTQADAIEETGEFTVALTVICDDLDDNGQFFEQLDGDTFGFSIGHRDGEISARDWNNDELSFDATEGQRLRVQVTYNDGLTGLFVNETEGTGNAQVTNSDSANDEFVVGGGHDADNDTETQVDNLVIYPTELDSDELSQDYDEQPWT